jgi:hypothetical protein
MKMDRDTMLTSSMPIPFRLQESLDGEAGVGIGMNINLSLSSFGTVFQKSGTVFQNKKSICPLFAPRMLYSRLMD